MQFAVGDFESLCQFIQRKIKERARIVKIPHMLIIVLYLHLDYLASLHNRINLEFIPKIQFLQDDREIEDAPKMSVEDITAKALRKISVKERIHTIAVIEFCESVPFWISRSVEIRVIHTDKIRNHAVILEIAESFYIDDRKLLASLRVIGF